MMFGFLREDTKYSTMRVSLFLVVLSVVFVLVCVGVYILKKAGCDAEIVNWSGMGVFIAAVVAAVTSIAWQKVKQKKIENEKSV